jgi:hypothetical protein
MLLQGDYVAVKWVSPLDGISPPYPAPSMVFPASKETVSCGHLGGPSPPPQWCFCFKVVLRREGHVWRFVTLDFRSMYYLGLFHFHCLSEVPRWSRSSIKNMCVQCEPYRIWGAVLPMIPVYNDYVCIVARFL